MSLRVLCIDDSKGVHAFLKQCLGDVAGEFYSVFDGAEGVLFLKEKGFDSVDLIFLDWEMPKMTGPEVLAEFKVMGVKIPVIMLTSKNDSGDIMKMLTLGASEYVLKPFTKEIILEKISFVGVGG